MSLSHQRRRRTAAVTTALVAGLATAFATLPVTQATAAPRTATAQRVTPSAPAVSTVSVGGLEVENSFVSSVGWVKPGDSYPSRIIVTNTSALPVTGATVTVTAPEGSTITAAGSGATVTGGGTGAAWTVPVVEPGATKTLVLDSVADTTAQNPEIVWRDISTSADVTVAGATQTATSHGPKVIPPSDTYDTARYGDRPFPVVPVQYRDRAYQAGHNGDSLESVINDPAKEGSTFNLYQEMSLGQLFPEGTVPSAGIATKDFTYGPGFQFSQIQPGQTCAGLTQTGGVPAPGTVGGPAYTERITDGVYNLPGNTGYYGSDANGSAIIGSLAGVGALQNIDSGCGPAGKMVYDAAAIADPEIDYSDYDTDKDGVVDFFMAVFAGCGGNGSSQLSVAGCDYTDAPYDNVWPHSSSLEYYYTDPDTGLAGYTTDDQLKDLEGRPLWYTDTSRKEMTTTDKGDALKVFVRVGPYNVNPETAIDKASVISHEYGHSLGLPDFYSTGSRETYGDWNLMATDKSQNMDAFSRQELGWVVPQVLQPGQTTTVSDWTDSKQDTGTITWQRPDGTPYTLTNGADGTVHNSEMYVAKLPGRQLLDPAKFDTGDKASKTHAWWSGSGNDFGCAPDGGHNLDVSIPKLATLPAGSTVNLSFKSNWDIEWDFDYGYVLTTTDGGKTYTSHKSDNGYTTSNTDPLAGNPNQNTCQQTYDNGITGTSGSYSAGSESTDRKLGNTPDSVFLADSYDISDLAGKPNGALRFSYATDPGLARPGWFIDDLKVTATTPSGQEVVLDTDFESDGGPNDERFYNGGCREDLTTAQQCTKGWKFLQAGAESEQDHAYYLEMRDRSGFDDDGHGQIDRDPIGWESGLYLAYTDEAHGYGNAGTDDPPAQSPLDATPEPGSETPDLNDAAFTAVPARSTFSDAGEGHTDNYTDPANTSVDSRYADVPNPWRFQYDCLGFQVQSMSGEAVGPQTSDGDLTGAVKFTMGQGCGTFDYGYTPVTGTANTAPTAKAGATPKKAGKGETVSFTGAGSDDAETPNDLDYTWDFDNGGSAKDASGVDVTHAFTKDGTYDVTLTVTDPMGETDTDTVTVTVSGDAPGNQAPVAKAKLKPRTPYTKQRVKLSGAGSSDAETAGKSLVYRWNFGDGGSKVDATGKVVRTRFAKAGYRTVALTVTDAGGKSTTVKKRVLVRREIACGARRVAQQGSWRTVRDDRVRGGQYCDNLGSGRGKDVLDLKFQGQQVDVWFGRATGGGAAKIVIDGRKVGTISFAGNRTRPRLTAHKAFTRLGKGTHQIKLIVTRGRAYVEGFGIVR
ncbi:immune inhibitor A [Nocardioides sp. KIGAM211]|uniref:Immune inhibitor A n=1 Tax=Nocardioides luti TaxID=2761101 RepID=A0A7X0RGU4_9ACTN|nr:PKD domain-containing protein [Nocardioides luti]MBB6627962.1 immune inhibitor A [Nocardioides luti]